MRTLVTAIILLLSINLVNAQGIDVKKMSFDEACKLAVKQNKLVFIDFTMNGCGPCKMMKQNVFPEKEVGDFFNEHFVSLIINISVDDKGRKLFEDAGATGCPFYGYYDPKTKDIIHYSGSYRPAKDFIRVSRNATDEKSCGVLLWDKYDEGDRSEETLKNLFYFLKDTYDKDFIKEVYNEYVKAFGKEAADKVLK